MLYAHDMDPHMLPLKPYNAKSPKPPFSLPYPAGHTTKLIPCETTAPRKRQLFA